MAYDTSTSIPAFRGLNQYMEINGDPTYAAEEKNVETKAGVLQPVAACTLLTPQLDHPIETLMLLHRRWYTGADDKDILVAASNGKLYSMLPNASEWTELTLPLASFYSNKWSWVTYEKSYSKDNPPVDVLIISNEYDGMYMIRGDDMSVSHVQTPKVFGVIERHAERIWGGAIETDPDMLVYSAPFDFTDWAEREEIPEAGAGDVLQPSWDGDSFTALRTFGDQLIAFKRTRVWRILGTNPGEYTMKEQYGGGAPYAKTIAVDTERILMLTDKGVAAYDGVAVVPFQQQFCQDIWKRMNKSHLDKASAILWNHKYYLTVPLDSSTINNAVIIYDTIENTWLLRDDLSVESFLGGEKDMWFTSSTTPGKIWKWAENSWDTGDCTASATRWVSPWMDLGAKNIVKGGFEIYFLAEVKDNPVTLSFSVQTEKKVKTKTYTVSPVINRGAKQKRLHFGGSGRRFRIIIESPASSPVWRLTSGLLVVTEIDPD